MAVEPMSTPAGLQVIPDLDVEVILQQFQLDRDGSTSAIALDVSANLPKNRFDRRQHA